MIFGLLVRKDHNGDLRCFSRSRQLFGYELLHPVLFNTFHKLLFVLVTHLNVLPQFVRQNYFLYLQVVSGLQLLFPQLLPPPLYQLNNIGLTGVFGQFP